MGSPRAELSVVVDAGCESYSDCGYCGQENCSLSHGMPVRNLTVYAYQDLIDQGWRRSGRYLYKPDLARSCCKAYTIRLDVRQFNPDKGQRRLLRKWRNFLAGHTAPSAAAESTAGSDDDAAAADTPDLDADLDLGLGSAAPGGDATTAGGSAADRQEPGLARRHQASRAGPTGSCGGSMHAAEAEEEEGLVQRLLVTALASAVAAGELPPADYPAPAVRRCTGKQRQALPADVRFTCSSAFPLAAAAAAATRRKEAALRRAETPSAATAATHGPGASAVADGPAARRASAERQGAGRDAGGALSSEGLQQSVAAAGGTSPTAQNGAAGTQPRNQQQQRKLLPPPEGALLPQDVARVLARHFNDAASSLPTGGAAASAAAGTGAGPSCSRYSGGGVDNASGAAAVRVGRDAGEPPEGAGMQTGSVACTAGVGAATAELRLRASRPQAYAANGHVNILPASAAEQQRRGEEVTAGARDQELEAAARGSGRLGPEAAALAVTKDNGLGQRAPAGTGSSETEGGDAGAVAGGGGGGGGGKEASRASMRAAAGAATAGVAIAGAAAAAPCAAAAGGEQLAVPSGRLQIRLVPSTFLQEEYELYCRYQTAQHGDGPAQLSRSSYTRFLVDSPLRPVGRDRDPAAPECGYGSFHQQYWLDGKLIAVGVVDVLPRCLSSVYFFWETALAALAPGRFSALQEIRWVQQQRTSSPELHCYYMGYYIHTCPKMRYKAEYRPSDLLCPVRKVWVRITPKLLAALDERPFLALSSEDGVLCQPNLAAPPGHAAAVTAQGSAGDATAQQFDESREQQQDVGSAGEPEEGVGVADTLLLLPGPSAAAGPIPLEVVCRYKLFPERAILQLEKTIRSWRAAVGWTAPALVYEL